MKKRGSLVKKRNFKRPKGKGKAEAMRDMSPEERRGPGGLDPVEARRCGAGGFAKLVPRVSVRETVF